MRETTYIKLTLHTLFCTANPAEDVGSGGDRIILDSSHQRA